MFISPLAIIYICYVFYILINSKSIKKLYLNMFILTCILEISMLKGYFIKIGGAEISILSIQTLVLMIISILVLFKETVRISKSMLLIIVLLLLFTFSQILINIAFPYKGLVLDMDIEGNAWDYYSWGICELSIKAFNIVYTIKGAIKLSYLAINAYLLKRYVEFQDIKYVLSKLIRFFKFVALFGIIEFVVKNVFRMPDLFYNITSFIFGYSDYGYTTPILRGGMYALQGFSNEPSHFNICIFSFLVLVVLYQRINDINNGTKNTTIIVNKWFVIGVILMLLSGGMSSIWCIAILLIEYYLVTRVVKNTIMVSNIKKMIKYVVLASLLLLAGYFVLLIFNSYYLTRISNMIGTLISMKNAMIASNGVGDMSSYARFLSIQTCFSNFLGRPILGLGAGFTECHDSTVSFLVQFGLMGFFIWYRIMLMPGKGNRKYDVLLLIVCIVIAGIPFGNPGSMYSFVYNILIVELTSFYVGKSNIVEEKMIGEKDNI